MRTGSYQGILGAVANVLDLADARTFAVSEGEHGLTLNFVDGRGERHTVELSTADLAELIAWSESRSEGARESVAGADGRDEGTLHAFLERHTLIGAH
ncbi:MAG TPA: hypothetical protein VE338_02495 [Ktedonobacterales bacterium]|jgi:type II secretory pathway component PulM|nr:hypothetical protein [Ktedonobacterales bacterium]